MKLLLIALVALMPLPVRAQSMDSQPVTITIGPPGVTTTLAWGCVYRIASGGAHLGLCSALQLSGQFLVQDIDCDVGNDPRCQAPYVPNWN